MHPTQFIALNMIRQGLIAAHNAQQATSAAVKRAAQAAGLLKQTVDAHNAEARRRTMTERGRVPRATTHDGRPAVQTRPDPRAGVKLDAHGRIVRPGFYVVEIAGGPNRAQRRAAARQRKQAR